MDVQHFVRSLVLLFFLLEVFFSVSLSRNVHIHNRHHHSLRHAKRHARHSSDVLVGESYVEESGPWGPWSDAQECSRSCGGGVSIETRKCVHVRHDGTHGCVGPSKRYFSCNYQDCPEGSVDFRAEQCSKFDKVPIDGRYTTWIPYTDLPNKCELNCRPQGERVYYRHDVKVIDGTRCDQDTLDICVDGVCMPVGCDLILGSNATEDKCRECRGNGSTCKTVEGLLNLDNLDAGYNDILLIPAGATNIHIQEKKATNNFLAIRNLTGHYYLNGNWRIDSPRDLSIAGTTFHYSRRPSEFQTPETLSALGPTTEPIYIMLLYQERNPGIVYEYSIPKSISTVQPDTYSWHHESYNECSRSCGGGVQSRSVYCTRTNSVEVVDDFLCDSALKPISDRSCNNHSCPPRWRIGNWEECSSSCGGGVQYRMVFCQQVQSGDSPTVVNNNLCLKVVGPRPKHTRSCNTDITCPEWRSSAWTKCNKLCGNGEQSRTVTCQRIVKGLIQVFPDQSCNMSQKPQSKRKCHNGPCEGVDWIVSEWTGCDACGLFRESRLVRCSNKSGTLFPDDLCDKHRQPEYLRDCPGSSSCEHMWMTTQWSECSAECGSGVQTRSVYCVQSNGDDFKRVDAKNCDPTKKYEESQNCSGKVCQGVWLTAPWGQCTATCSGGSRTRKIICMVGEKVEDDSNCDATMKPDSKEPCNMKPCDEDEMIMISGCKDSKHGCCKDNVTSATGPNLLGCPTEKNPVDCNESEFGCCSDGETAALDPFKDGCPEIVSCEETKFNCCTDGVSVAKGPNFEGCPNPLEDCTNTKHGCCPDGWTPAKGEKYFGCEFESQIDCQDTTFGCCLDNISPAHGPAFQGCNDDDIESSGEDCHSTPNGCCSDDITPAKTPDKSDCPDNFIPAFPNYGGPVNSNEDYEDDCVNTTFGCCPDLINIALGPNHDGCPFIGITPLPVECELSLYGCCPDDTSPATGPNYAGCNVDNGDLSDCENYLYGCCPDGKTPAKGFEEKGCEAETTTTISTTVSTTSEKISSTTTTSTDKDTTTGTGSTDKDTTTETGSTSVSTDKDTTTGTGSTTAEDSTTLSDSTTISGGTTSSIETTTGDSTATTVKDCASSQYGCCEDQITPAQGPKFKGCPEPMFTDCTKSTFGCCPDGVSEALGSNNEGCLITGPDCTASPFGCCPDKKTEAKGPGSFGCPCDTMKFGCCPDGINFARGPNYEGCGCVVSQFGCCSDEFTPALGPNQEGCNCSLGLFGCCPDGQTEASGPNYRGCCQSSQYGCCSDGSTAATGPNKEGCGCSTTKFGCCSDGTTSATGPNKAGCTCDTTTYGCCPDLQTPAGGTNYAGCPCFSMPFGCCPDNITPAQGENEEGCGGCESTEYGCCPDNKTPAQGFNEEGCGSCESTEFGCCPDGQTPAQGYHNEGCEEPCVKTQYGCCPDGKTPAQGYQNEGCEEPCVKTQYGCCPDGKTPAQGYQNEGCEEPCVNTQYGCCPDGKTPARGPQYAGCGCRATYYGCCPDGITSAQGDDYEGCKSCELTTYGCCPDEKTPAQGPNQEGCGCESSRWGCCPDGVTFARGVDNEGCVCGNTRYGCCPDGVTAATGPQYHGCEVRPPTPGGMKAGIVCGLNRDQGSCSNFTVKWAFDMEYGGCTRFWYGGCDGNDNRFETQEECEEVCVIPEGMDACQLPKTAGSCDRYTVTWYYDVPSRQCGQFYYGGCLGNNNRFATQEECERTCADTQIEDPCVLPKVEGPCNNNTNSWFYDKDDKMCKEFRYGGCKGNRNNFPSERECIQQCASTNLKDSCLLPKEVGPCAGLYTRWFYNIIEGQCKAFTYSGCQGNTNRFESLHQCEISCNNTKVGDVCSLPKVEGPCKEQAIRWYYDSAEGRCSQFYYGGCDGNANRFESEVECQHVCSAVQVTDVCALPSDHGPCSSAAEERWYYNQNTGRCDIFIYGGCGGNGNNFVAQAECEHKCSAKITTPEEFKIEDCHLDKAYGRCDEVVVKWYYKKDTGVCDQFHYSGCNGNNNRFETRQDCELKCFHSQDICELPKVVGPCKGDFRQFYYNPQTNECEEFVFGGCLGNGNRFNNLIDCQARCKRTTETSSEITGGTTTDPCSLPRDSGPCQSTVDSWFYDKDDRLCRSFVFGGCGGNTNRFSSEESCKRACGEFKDRDVCSLQYDRGPCVGNFPKWYHDPLDNQCKSFVYGGCSGNGNRFENKKECEQVCIAHGDGNQLSISEICRLPADGGPCTNYETRWYYDSIRGTCVPFNYGGCRGNKNRFKSFDICLGVCSAPTCPVAEECSSLSCPYGIEEYKDENGCTKCRCTNPCNGISCPKGSTCVVEKPGIDDAGAHPVCRRDNKPGQCPRAVVVSKHQGQCIDECNSDPDCESDYKCCQNGCGRRCLHPFGHPSPQIDPSDEEVRIRVNNTARIPCIAHGEPRPFIYWRKDGHDFAIDDVRIKFVNDYLEIHDIQQSDVGLYTCVADNGYGTPAEKHTRVIVEEPARIIPGVRVVVVAVGSPCLLHCKASGYPNPTVTWWRGYIMLPSKSEQYEQFTNYSLLIRSVLDKDYGDYSCQAYNGIGDPARWEITVANSDNRIPNSHPVYSNPPSQAQVDPYHSNLQEYPHHSNPYDNVHHTDPHENPHHSAESPTVNGGGNESEEVYYYYEDDENVPILEDAPHDSAVVNDAQFYSNVGDKNSKLLHEAKVKEQVVPVDVADDLFDGFDESMVLGRFLDDPIKKKELNNSKKTSDFDDSDQSTYNTQSEQALSNNSENADPFDLANKLIGEISVETLELPDFHNSNNLEVKTVDDTTESSSQIDSFLHDDDNTNQSDLTSDPLYINPYFSQDDTQNTTSTSTSTTSVDDNSVPVSAEIILDSTVFPMNSDIRIDCATNGSEKMQWFKDEAKLISGPRVQIMNNGTVIIYNAKPSDTGTYKCEAANEFNSASSSVSITINGFELHVNCTDNPYFANCKLVVKANYCSNVYYARFCCKTCTLAGQLPVTGSHLHLINNKIKK